MDLLENLRNPKYFIERFFWIIDKDRNEVPFKFNPIQEKYYTDRTQSDLILKARKEGLSSLILVMWLHSCLFFRNTRAVVVSHEAEATKRLFGRVKFTLQTMGLKDMRLTVPLSDDSQNQMQFPDTNSSFWVGTAGSRAFGRGDDITHLHLSEVAHYQDQAMLTGVMEACVPNAWKVLETTANGVGDLFWRMWDESKNAGSRAKWKRHFYSWFDDPQYCLSVPDNFNLSAEEKEMKGKYHLTDGQIFWYREKKASMLDKALLAQEYPSNDREAFLTSGHCIFDKSGMEIQDRLVEEAQWVGFLRDTGYKPEFVLDEHGPLKIFRPPEPNRKYFIFCDVAKGGEKGDRSVAGVWDRHTKSLAALWAGRIDPVDFGNVIYGLGLHYNTAKVAVEVWPGPGIATGAQLVALKYPNLYRHLAWDGQKHADTAEIGWKTDERSRYDMLSTLQDAVSNKWVIVRARDVVDECYNFIRKPNGRPEARAGCFDDCVIMAAGALHCMKYDPVEEMLRLERGQNLSVVGSVVKGSMENKKHGKMFRRLKMGVAG